jgi:hypothetical protein
MWRIEVEDGRRREAEGRDARADGPHLTITRTEKPRPLLSSSSLVARRSSSGPGLLGCVLNDAWDHPGANAHTLGSDGNESESAALAAGAICVGPTALTAREGPHRVRRQLLNKMRG